MTQMTQRERRGRGVRCGCPGRRGGLGTDRERGSPEQASSAVCRLSPTSRDPAADTRSGAVSDEPGSRSEHPIAHAHAHRLRLGTGRRARNGCVRGPMPPQSVRRGPVASPDDALNPRCFAPGCVPCPMLRLACRERGAVGSRACHGCPWGSRLVVDSTVAGVNGGIPARRRERGWRVGARSTHYSARKRAARLAYGGLAVRRHGSPRIRFPLEFGLLWRGEGEPDPADVPVGIDRETAASRVPAARSRLVETRSACSGELCSPVRLQAPSISGAAAPHAPPAPLLLRHLRPSASSA